ncbi:MAG: Adenine DNA glycosylase [Magnetococcales bacterium]|nr:Adenine DNA glycosylase [Magnetococcales bacterium]HIJ85507.1 A/G-specific adenine glycosylase [Magnetococcales bacterium]
MDATFPYAARLLKFYHASGRQLPWRGEGDPYRIWVSEVMLQQTGVATVKGYYGRFIDKFPTVAELAGADLGMVLKEWQGLGYYRRAENLHRGAKVVHDSLGGCFPETLERWMSLPGVGRSTAAAIMAIGWNQRQAILDGNCKRVLARVMALDDPVNSAQGERLLWQRAYELTPADRPGDYAQAIMDLGATVCTPRAPRCRECPWCLGCRAWETQQVDRYPNRKKPKVRPRYGQVAVLVQNSDGQWLMRRRPRGGLLAGLWEPLSTKRWLLPQLPPDMQKVGEELKHQWQVCGRNVQLLGEVRHTFTHFHLTVWVCLCQYVSGWPLEEEVRWWNPEQSDLPLSTLHAKVFAVHDHQGGANRIPSC